MLCGMADYFFFVCGLQIWFGVVVSLFIKCRSQYFYVSLQSFWYRGRNKFVFLINNK